MTKVTRDAYDEEEREDQDRQRTADSEASLAFWSMAMIHGEFDTLENQVLYLTPAGSTQEPAPLLSEAMDSPMAERPRKPEASAWGTRSS